MDSLIGSGLTHSRFSGTEGDTEPYFTYPQELITDSTSDLYVQFVPLSQLPYAGVLQGSYSTNHCISLQIKCVLITTKYHKNTEEIKI